MKQICLLITAIIMISICLVAQPTDIVISEYVEGSSNNKALEFYNGTGNSIDLGTGNYVVQIFFNGSPSSTTTISLTGVVAGNDVYVLADDGAHPAILAETDQQSTSIFYNGDDAVVLRKGGITGIILDAIGQVGFDPGTEWGSGLVSTADNTLRRKVGTTVGDTNPDDVFDPSVGWDGYPTDTFDGLGSPSPLPVELSHFSAIILDNAVKLSWRTETEVNNYGFEIQRAHTSTPLSVTEWNALGFVQGHGNSNSPKEYSFIDDLTITPNLTHTLLYRLKQIDTDGKFEYSKIISVDLGSPAKFKLSQNYPNPFNPVTTIKFSIPQTGNVKLTVYNLLGEEVAELANGFWEAGVHTVNFNASSLNSGVYIYKISTEGFIQSRKMTLIK